MLSDGGSDGVVRLLKPSDGMEAWRRRVLEANTMGRSSTMRINDLGGGDGVGCPLMLSNGGGDGVGCSLKLNDRGGGPLNKPSSMGWLGRRPSL